MEAATDGILPAYSPAADTPQYTSEPRPDEERLQINRRVIQEETGVYVEKNKHVRLVLTNQSPTCTEPTYGQGASVRGALDILKPESVVRVEVKLEGVMSLTMASVVITENAIVPLFTEQEVLFQRPVSLTTAESKRASLPFLRTSPSSTAQICQALCPSKLTFCLIFPTTYRHHDQRISHSLPPTYSARLEGIPGVHLETKYTLQATIIRRGSLIDKKVLLTIPINYFPRSRPYHPSLPPSMTFLSTLKSSPEEWRLFESKTAVREGGEGVHIIHSSLLLPQSQIYPINNPIPFHLQLSSTSRGTLAQFSSVKSQSTTNRLSSFSKTWLTSAKASNATSSSSASRPNSSMRPSSSHLDKGKAQDQFPLRRSASSVTRTTVGNTSAVPSELSGNNSSTRVSNMGKIQVSVQRHTSVQVIGQWVQIKRCISSYTMNQCTINGAILNGAPGGMPSLAWEGQINILDVHRTCGGFSGPGVRVQDFILLSVIPHDSDHSSLQEIHHLVPIRLTTDLHSEELRDGIELARQQAL